MDLAKDRNKMEVCLRIQEFSDELTDSQDTRSESQEYIKHIAQNVFFREGPSVSSAQLERGSSLEEDSLARSAEVASILECPVCLDTMVRVRIYQCRNGHNVCERCSANPSLVSCPQCREPYR